MDANTLENSVSTEKGKGKATDNFVPSKSGLMTASEAAYYMHPSIKASTVRRMIRDKTILAKKIGKSYYILKDEIERFLEKCQGEESQQDYFKEETTGHGSSLMAEIISGQDMVTDFLERQRRS